MTSNARNRTRVVLHVDLDAFYCELRRVAATTLLQRLSPLAFALKQALDFTGQVEMKRVGIPPHIPCAVQQWEGLIAGDEMLGTVLKTQSCKTGIIVIPDFAVPLGNFPTHACIIR